MVNRNPTLTEEHKARIGIANAFIMRQKVREGHGPNRKTIDNLVNYNKIRREQQGYINSMSTRRKLSYQMKWRFCLGLHNKTPWNKGLTANNSLIVHQIKIKKTGQIRNAISRERMRLAQLKYIQLNPIALDKLRENRKKVITPKQDTSIEVKIQNYLKILGFDFFTHQYIDIPHGYRCDILIPSIKTIIECDGNYWHDYPKGREIDSIRTRELIEKGYRVIRLWESEIKYFSLVDLKNKMEVIN